jgi:mono/diheme cytochrome c family protein
MSDQSSHGGDSTLTRFLRSLRQLALALLLVIMWVAPAQAQATAEAGQRQATADSAVLSDQVIDAGRSIFHGSGTCHACHGDDLQGGAIAPSLRGPKWRHVDGSFKSILERVRQGKDGTLMVGHPGDISDAEAVQAATYVWAVSQGKAKP